MLNRLRAALASLRPSTKQSNHQQLKIDLVTEHPDTGRFSMILVEVGPWEPGTEEQQLRRLQTRLYDCVDAAVDGHLAGKYPGSRGRTVRIVLDTYDIPAPVIQPFFKAFTEHVATWTDVQEQIRTQRYVQLLEFEYNPRLIESGSSPS